MALKINDTTLQTAKDLNAAGDVAGAYRILVEAGDNYAANALVVIKRIGVPESLFARIVLAHWDKPYGIGVKLLCPRTSRKFHMLLSVHP